MTPADAVSRSRTPKSREKAVELRGEAWRNKGETMEVGSDARESQKPLRESKDPESMVNRSSLESMMMLILDAILMFMLVISSWSSNGILPLSPTEGMGRLPGDMLDDVSWWRGINWRNSRGQ